MTFETGLSMGGLPLGFEVSSIESFEVITVEKPGAHCRESLENEIRPFLFDEDGVWQFFF